MAAINPDDVIKVDNYNGIIINEYEGSYSLNAVDAGQNDTYYIAWCMPSFFDKAQKKRRFREESRGEKPTPVKIKLGDSFAEAKVTWEEIGKRAGFIEDNDDPFA